MSVDVELLTNFSPPDDEGGVVEELLLILSIDHLTAPTIKTTNQQLKGGESREGAGGATVPDTGAGTE